MKVSFTIPEDIVEIAVAMIEAKTVESQRGKETLGLAIEKAKAAPCVELDSAEIFDDQQLVVLIGLAVAAVSACMK